MNNRTAIPLAALLFTAVGATLGTTPAVAARQTVSNETELRAAVHAANSDPSITEIVFARGAVIELTDEVRYVGHQDLTLKGRNATRVGCDGGRRHRHLGLRSVRVRVRR